MITSLGTAQFILILEGLKWTLILSLVAFAGGGVSGLVIALCRTSRFVPLRIVTSGYIEAVRGTPLLMQLFLVYYGVALLRISIDPWMAVTIGFALHASGYLGEIWRGSIQAVSRGQSEAAAALGFRYWNTMRFVILPQAFKIAIPPTIGFLVQLIKGTSLAAIVGFIELARTAEILSNVTYKPLFIYGIVAALYFMICWPLSLYSRRLERNLARA